MERLSLEDFKAKSNSTDELEQLTGGILGSCHDEPSWWDVVQDYIGDYLPGF